MKWLRSNFVFKEKHFFTEKEDNYSGKIVIVDEELDGIDAVGIGSIEDLPR